MEIRRVMWCLLYLQMPMLPVLRQIVPGAESIFHYFTTSPIDLRDAALLMKRERICYNEPGLLLCKRGIFSNQKDF
jgi:hypothetical protein